MVQADSSYGQTHHRDDGADDRPESDAGHGASTDDAGPLQRKNDPGQGDEHSHADEQEPLHADRLFPSRSIWPIPCRHP
jgi:hypothetical protein